MKILSSVPFSRYGWNIGVINALLAVALTILSFRYVEPKNCYRLCDASNAEPCPTGSCRFGEQKAGWPLPVFVDMPGGGSPTSGWGLLGPEDLPDFIPMLLDVLFYSALLWLVFVIVQLVRKRAASLRPIMTTLSLNLVLVISLWLFYAFFGHFIPLGRGQSIQVYIDTPTDRGAGSAFSPNVSIPVQELIQNYGNPDGVWLASEGSTTRLVLHWNSIGMFVQLPEVTDRTYVVKKTTKVKTIIFPYEEPVIAFDGKSLGEKSIPWTGYGTYQP